MPTTPITTPTAAEIIQQLHDAQTALAEARTYFAHHAAMESALARLDLGRPALLELVDTTCRATARAVVRLELGDQPADTSALTIDALAQLLSAADVKIHDGDYPSWDDLHESGQDQYRETARFLLARCSVTNRAAAPAEEPTP